MEGEGSHRGDPFKILSSLGFTVALGRHASGPLSWRQTFQQYKIIRVCQCLLACLLARFLPSSSTLHFMQSMPSKCHAPQLPLPLFVTVFSFSTAARVLDLPCSMPGEPEMTESTVPDCSCRRRHNDFLIISDQQHWVLDSRICSSAVALKFQS